MMYISISISTNSNFKICKAYNSRLDTIKVLLALLAGRISQDLAALVASIGGTISRAVLGDSHNNVTIAQLLAGGKGGRTAVVLAVGVVGDHPVAAVVHVRAVILVGVGQLSGFGGLSSGN